jgi:putative ABC transport system ATP-binding protein
MAERRRIVSLSQLSKVYQPGSGISVTALDTLDFEVEEGDFVAVMGSSGSGKSTLMNVIGCLDQPTSGTYLLDGETITFGDARTLASIRNQKIGFIFQDFHLLPRTSALENVELPLLYHPDCPGFSELRDRATEALTLVSLGDRVHHYPNELSGGQQQRVAIARALINKPSLLLADEPTGNLDSRTTLDVMALFQDLNDQGLTILIVTHEPEIKKYVKRTVTLRDGRIISDQQTPRISRARDDRLKLEEEADVNVTLKNGPSAL